MKLSRTALVGAQCRSATTALLRRLPRIAHRACIALLASWLATTVIGANVSAQTPQSPSAATSAIAGARANAAAPDRSAATPTSLLPTQQERDRFHRLAEELRCLVCQNQTLADSDADLAADLRREVETMMLAGRSDDEIKTFLVQRYGDFVLYRPPMQRNTWLLWLGPFALLSIGAIAWWRIQGRRTPQAGVDVERARRLLDD